jgi:hypothetical protein
MWALPLRDGARVWKANYRLGDNPYPKETRGIVNCWLLSGHSIIAQSVGEEHNLVFECKEYDSAIFAMLDPWGYHMMPLVSLRSGIDTRGQNPISGQYRCLDTSFSEIGPAELLRYLNYYYKNSPPYERPCDVFSEVFLVVSSDIISFRYASLICRR